MISASFEVHPRQNRSSMKGFGLLLAVLCLLVPACTEESEPAAAGDPVVHTYNLRGEIVSLPDPADPASELKIHHEAINDFKDGEGKADPMRAMTMSFSPASDTSLDGLAVGDAVEFEFHMHWSPSVQMQADGFKKLPTGTELNFGEAHTQEHNH